MRLSRSERQEILDEFLSRHGRFDARLFRDEVKEAGETHPAWDEFTWNEEDAADAYQIWQARMFVQGLRISYSVDVIHRGISSARVVEVPFLFSPPDTRHQGGGYIPMTSDPETMAKFCHDGAATLRSWLFRYSGAVTYAGASPSAINRIINQLEAVSFEDVEEG